MTFLVIDWHVTLVKIAQFILAFSILIVLHEIGHFAPAKWFKCRVEKFMLFFDPSFALFKKKIGETIYGIGWIPLGGYVKISGMVDESMDKEQLKQPPQPWEFRSKPAWQRLIIMIGGVTMNVLLAFVIFAMILFVWGEEYLPAKNMKYGIVADSLGRKIGLRDGDKLVSVGGKPVDNFATVGADIIIHEAKTIDIDRDGQAMTLAIPEGFIRSLNKNKLDHFIEVRFPVIVDSVAKDKVKLVSGELKKGDELLAINDVPAAYFNQYDSVKRTLKNQEVGISVLRNGVKDSLRAKLDSNGSLGMYPVAPSRLLGTKITTYGFFASFPAGVRMSGHMLVNYMSNLKLLFTSKEIKVNESLGSVISIGNMFPGVWDWQRFWTLTGVLSIILAFMNILPIPALDGGHILFLLVEIISGRKPSDKFMEYAQVVGMVLVLGLMAYAIGLDVFRLFKH